MDQFGPDHARKEFEEFQEKLALEEPHFKLVVNKFISLKGEFVY